jgi:hypothetical protein
MRTFVKILTLLISFFLSATLAYAQDDNFRLSVVNLVQTDINKLEFDVYLLDTDAATSFELASCQLGFLVNSSIHQGANLTAEISNTGSGLNSSQIFTANPSVATSLSGYSGLTLIRLAGRTPPTAGNGTIISTSGNGTLLTHFILSGTVNFASSTTPDITFTSSSSLSPVYATRVNEYINSENTALTVIPGVNAIVYGNPVLNAGVGIENNNQGDPVKIYPIPFRDILTIETGTNNQLTEYKITDSAGKTLAKGTFSSETTVSTENLPAGVYILKLDDGLSVKSHKIIKK